MQLLERTTGFHDWPAPDSDNRKAAWEAWTQAGFPTHKDEEWKYTSLRDAAETVWRPAPGADVCLDDLEAFSFGPTAVLINGRFSAAHSNLDQLPQGVTVASLSGGHALLGSIASLAGKLGSTNDERFKHLNTALFEDGVLVYVRRSAGSEQPITILHINVGDKIAVFPRSLIVVEDGAQAKVVESYVGLSGKVFTDAVTEIHVATGAVLEHVRYQAESRESTHIGLVAVHQDAESTYTNYNTHFGSRIGRTDVNLWLNGEHTESRLDGVYVATGEQVLDNKTRIDHAKPNCHSFEVYKGVLAGRGTGVFNGKIFVYEDAQKTDAKQTNQALLLSPTATINTKPQLEIFADDVKCTHGATVGQLQEDQLFYLRARGIPEKEARALLVYAFAADVLERITMEPVREALERELYRKLHEETELETSEEMPSSSSDN